MLVRGFRPSFGTILAIIAAGFLAACSSNQAPVNTGTVAPATPMSAMQNGAMPMGKAAVIPKGLHCTDGIVWVNMTKKTYHDPSDPWYGRTKHGQYMCKAAAEAAGYHVAGMRHSPKTMMKGAMPTPAPAST
jgi:hypothetical protein